MRIIVLSGAQGSIYFNAERIVCFGPRTIDARLNKVGSWVTTADDSNGGDYHVLESPGKIMELLQNARPL